MANFSISYNGECIIVHYYCGWVSLDLLNQNLYASTKLNVLLLSA